MSTQNQLSRFGSDLVIYGFGVAANAAVRFIVLMIAARVLVTAEFGFFDNLLIIGIIISNIFITGNDSAIVRLVFDKNERTEHRKLLSATYVITAIAAVIFTIAAAILYQFGDSYLPAQYIDLPLVFGLVIYGIGLAVYALNTSFMRALFLKKTFLAATGAGLVLRTAPLFAVAAAPIVELHILFGALAAGAVAAACFTSFQLRKYVEISANILSKVKPLLAYGAPLAIIVVIASLQPAVERALILHFGDPMLLARYAAAAFPALLIGIMIQVLNSAWTPYALKKHAEDDHSTFHIIAIITTALIGTVYMVFALMAQFIIALFVPIGDPLAATLFPFIGLVIVLRSLSTFTSLGFAIAKASKTKLALYVVNLVAGLTLSLILFPRIGIAAVPIGFFASNLVIWFLEAALARKMGGPKWPMVQMCIILGGMLATAVSLQTDSIFLMSGIPSARSALIAGIAIFVAFLVTIRAYRQYNISVKSP